MHAKRSLWRQTNAPTHTHTHASCMQLENAYTCFTKPGLHTHTHCVAHPWGRFKYLCGWLCHNCSVIQVLFALLCKLGHLKENEQFDKSMMIRLRLIGTNYPRLSYFNSFKLNAPANQSKITPLRHFQLKHVGQVDHVLWEHFHLNKHSQSGTGTIEHL